MAHSFLKKLLDAETSHFRLEIISCLTGGLFLVDAWLTSWIYDNQDLSEYPAIIAALLLGTPLIWHAICDLWHGESEMNEFAVIGRINGCGIDVDKLLATLIECFACLHRTSFVGKEDGKSRENHGPSH